MDTLNEKIINERVEAYRTALIANVEASRAEINARQAKVKAHKALQMAREALLELTSGSWEIGVSSATGFEELLNENKEFETHHTRQ